MGSTLINLDIDNLKKYTSNFIESVNNKKETLNFESAIQVFKKADNAIMTRPKETSSKTLVGRLTVLNQIETNIDRIHKGVNDRFPNESSSKSEENTNYVQTKKKLHADRLMAVIDAYDPLMLKVRKEGLTEANQMALKSLMNSHAVTSSYNTAIAELIEAYPNVYKDNKDAFLAFFNDILKDKGFRIIERSVKGSPLVPLVVTKKLEALLTQLESPDHLVELTMKDLKMAAEASEGYIPSSPQEWPNAFMLVPSGSPASQKLLNELLLNQRYLKSGTRTEQAQARAWLEAIPLAEWQRLAKSLAILDDTRAWAANHIISFFEMAQIESKRGYAKVYKELKDIKVAREAQDTIRSDRAREENKLAYIATLKPDMQEFRARYEAADVATRKKMNGEWVAPVYKKELEQTLQLEQQNPKDIHIQERLIALHHQMGEWELCLKRIQDLSSLNPLRSAELKAQYFIYIGEIADAKQAISVVEGLERGIHRKKYEMKNSERLNEMLKYMPEGDERVRKQWLQENHNFSFTKVPEAVLNRIAERKYLQLSDSDTSWKDYQEAFATERIEKREATDREFRTLYETHINNAEAELQRNVSDMHNLRHLISLYHQAGLQREALERLDVAAQKTKTNAHHVKMEYYLLTDNVLQAEAVFDEMARDAPDSLRLQPLRKLLDSYLTLPQGKGFTKARKEWVEKNLSPWLNVPYNVRMWKRGLTF